MRVTVTKSNKDGSPCAQLDECIAFFNKDIVDDLIIGNSYDVMIVGYSRQLNKRTNFPSVVFLNLIQEGDVLVRAPILECSGHMCATSTYHRDHGSIYPGFNTVVPTVDNVNNHFREIPNYPTPEIPMWIRKNKRGSHSAIGVDCYEHLHPVFIANHAGIQRVAAIAPHLAKIDAHYEGKDREHEHEGLKRWEALKAAKVLELGIRNFNGCWVFESEVYKY